MSFWRLIYRFSWTLLGILLTIGLVCMFVPKLRRHAHLRETRDGLKRKNDALRDEIRTLCEKQERFTTEPPYIERTAREMGMIREGEAVYLFTNATNVAAAPGVD